MGDPNLNEGFPGYTRMTYAQADEFLSKYQIAHQWSDNPTPTGSRPAPEGIDGYPKLNTPEIPANTGFSATLIERIENGQGTGEYTLAMRSTEFRDWSKGGDGERDKTGADISSIGFNGFALAQLDAMERYYQWLKDNGKLAGMTKLNVTGYSLGGQLATVFTEMHQGEMGDGETVTFNGAGRGNWNSTAGGLSDIINYYRSVLHNPELAPSPGGGASGALREAARGRVGLPFDDKSLYDDARYLWAVSATQLQFGLSWPILADESRTGTAADTRITQLFGWETQNNIDVTANSGVHGPVLRVGIESQPLLEAFGGFFGTPGNFGSGHSITLIADSLALQRAMNQLDTSFDPSKFIDLLPATTYRRTANGPNANYETDALENVLDALRRAILGLGVAKTDFKDGASGFGDITRREGYYANLQALTDSPAFQSLLGNVLLQTTNGADLQQEARQDFGALLALQTLSPIRIVGKNADAAAVLNGLWQNSSDPALRDAWARWNQDRITGTPEHYTDRWIEDRSAMLGKLRELNIGNIDPVTGSVSGVDGKTVNFEDLATNTRFIAQGNVGSTAGKYAFGTEAADTNLKGLDGEDHIHGRGGVDRIDGASGDDKLYGDAGADEIKGGSGKDEIHGGADNDKIEAGADNDEAVGAEGDDTLKGDGGNDILWGDEAQEGLTPEQGPASELYVNLHYTGDDQLEGGKGNDRLFGGAGRDTYIVGEGIDTLRDDAQGQGLVKGQDGYVFTGGKQKYDDNTWESADGRSLYIRRDTSLLIVQDHGVANRTIVENFDFAMAQANGYLGIQLLGKDDTGPRGGGGGGGIAGPVNTFFTGGISWVRPRDPLVLDLDGDGIELTAGPFATVFDHNADALSTGTQWVKPDDGFLVRDLDGSGTIDSGRELFGDQTVLPSGQNAATGFAALAPLDTNGDQHIDAADTAFGELGVWQDANQDGLSQAGEVATLGELGITQINLAPGADGKVLFTQDGAGQEVRSVNFGTNAFYREFEDTMVETAAAQALPELRGSGLVRDLRQAMSLGTPQAEALAAGVAAFQNAQTAQERQALVDTIIQAWGNTSSLQGGTLRHPPGSQPASVANAMAFFAANDPQTYARVTALEQFNGQAVLERYVGLYSGYWPDPATGGTQYYARDTVYLDDFRQQHFFEPAYRELHDSVYRNLYVQSAAGQYLDLIEVVTDADGVHMDFSAVNQLLHERAQADPAQAAVDLAELVRLGRDGLNMTGWDVAGRLDELLDSATFSAPQQAALAQLGYRFAAPAGGTLAGAETSDALVGAAGSDVLYGSIGDDVLLGGGGNDQLYGGHGDDQLVGGQGTDHLEGQGGNDTYTWTRGDGNDSVLDLASTQGRTNIVVLRGLDPQDVTIQASQNANGLGTNTNVVQFTIIDSGETLSVQSAYDDHYSDRAPVEFVFDDGTRWTLGDVLRHSLPAPTAGHDVLLGTILDDLPDRLAGGAGDDFIIGREGNDVVEGGAGNDTLWNNGRQVSGPGGAMQWTTDYVSTMGPDADVYVFGLGDGQDLVQDRNFSAGQDDTLRFKEGISPGDLVLAQRGADLVVGIRDTTDEVTIQRFFEAQFQQALLGGEVNGFAVERFEFADGTVWGAQEIADRAWAGTDAQDEFMGDGNANLMGGSAGDDVLRGNNGSDSLAGGAGDDALHGGGGDDVLDGGAGDDTLDAGSGADIIRFGHGDGNDTLLTDVVYSSYYAAWYGTNVVTATGDNVVELKEGVMPEDVQLVREDAELSIRLVSTGDVLTVRDFYTGTPDQLNLREIRFADGTVWAGPEILAQCLVGTDAAEAFEGFGTDDVFDGNGGADAYRGRGGTDTFLFGRDDGKDSAAYGYQAGESAILQFKETVLPDDVQVRRLGNAAVFSIAGTSDSISFDQAFRPNGAADGLNWLAEVRFADGTVWLPAEVNARATQGSGGDDWIEDVLSGSASTLHGGAGDDTLRGARGNSVYLFNRGDGHDVVDESGAQSAQADTVIFGADIAAGDLIVSTSDEDLVIDIAGTTDRLTIRDGAYGVIETIQVGGVSLSDDDILSLAQVVEGSETLLGTAGDDVLVGTGADSTISGFTGHDTLTGNAGADVLEGGEGDDALDGGAGRDELVGGEGSNTYHFARGDALDTLLLTGGSTDLIELGAGISLSDISVQLGFSYDYGAGEDRPTQLVIGFGGNDAMDVRAPEGTDFLSGAGAGLSVRLADATVLDIAQLLALQDEGVAGYYSYDESEPTVLLGSQADDELSADYSPSFLDGRGGNDYLQGDYGSLLMGGPGDDTLSSGGNTVYAGGTGDDEIDVLRPGSAALFNAGDGKDSIGGTGGAVSFGAGISPEDVRVWFDVSHDELVFSFVGSNEDEVRAGGDTFRHVQFVDAQGHVEVFDLEGMLDDPRFATASLEAASAATARAIFTEAPEFELTGARPVHGDAAAIAYAQTGDVHGTLTIVQNEVPGAGQILFGTPQGDDLQGGEGDDYAGGGFGDDHLAGGAGADHLSGREGSDTLAGGGGDDVLVGGGGDDVLHGGAGSDQAYGGEGDDSYLFNLGDGSLYIQDYVEPGYENDEYMDGDYGTNELVFGAGISLADLAFAVEGDALVVTIAGSPADRIVMEGTEYDDSDEFPHRSVARLVFDDGETVWMNELLEAGAWSEDGPGYGNEYDNELHGGESADALYGYAGDDVLVGSHGEDAYFFWLADGNDVIVDNADDANTMILGEGIEPDDLSLTVDGGVATLSFSGTSVTLQGWDGALPGQSPIASFLFADGSSLSMDALFNRSRTIRGTPDEDVLGGSAADDRIEGLAGDDVLVGGGGDDLYVIAAGSGRDSIIDVSELGQDNTILFADIADDSTLQLSMDAQGQLVVRQDDGNSVTLSSFDRLSPLGGRAVQYFQFGQDGPVLSYEQLLERGFTIDGTQDGDVLKGTALHDVVTAGEGNDIIEASAGGDLVRGQAGDDRYGYRLGDGHVVVEDAAGAVGGNSILFGEGITRELLVSKLRFTQDAADPSSNRFMIVFDQDDSISVTGFDPDTPESAAHGIDAFEFADGSVMTWDEVLDLGFVIEGDGTANHLLGTARNDRLYGYAGEDWLQAGGSDDVLTGGTGNDRLEGQAGADNYVFNLGDGADDRISDNSPGNGLTFGPGIEASSIAVTREAVNGRTGYRVHYGTLGDSVLIESVDASGAEPRGIVIWIELADGTVLMLDDLLNQPPVVAMDLEDRAGQVGGALDFTIDAGAFIDLDGDALAFSASLDGGEPLPDWLLFDGQSRTFSGTPPAGAQGTYTVQVTVQDPWGGQASQTFSLEIAPYAAPNVGPYVQQDEAYVPEDASFVVQGNVLHNDKDPDGGTLQVATAGTFYSTYGILSLSADGAYTYKLDYAMPQVQSLQQGQTVEDVFGYTATDGIDSAVSQLVVRIVGANDSPLVTADRVDFSVVDTNSVSGNVLANDSDPDQGDSLHVGQPGVQAGLYGSLQLSAAGGYTYVLDLANPAVAALGTGPGLLDSFTYQVEDGYGGSVSATLEIGIDGANHKPAAQPDVASLTPGQQVVQGNVLANDADADAGDVLAVSDAGPRDGLYGSLQLAGDGSYTYTLDAGSAGLQNLGEGQQGNDIFAYTVHDGQGGTAAATLTIQVTGTNSAPVAVDDAASVGVGDPVATGNVLANDQDLNKGDGLAVQNPGAQAGLYGALDIAADGGYTYTLQSDSVAVLALATGQQAVDAFSYTVIDSQGHTDTAIVEITVEGANDAPEAQADELALPEGETEVTGNVLDNDSDPDQGDTLLVADPGVLGGQYGSATLAADGDFSYVLDNDSALVQALAAGETVVDMFSYTVTDSQGATAMASVQVEITGVDGLAAMAMADSGTTHVARADANGYAIMEPRLLLPYFTTESGTGAGSEWMDTCYCVDGEAQKLVQAMASFSPPVAGDVVHVPYRADSLANAIAANWQ